MLKSRIIFSLIFNVAKKMNKSFLVLCSTTVIYFTIIQGYQSDEYYCKKTLDWEVCRRCINITQECETTEDSCSCDNIGLYKKRKGNF